MKDDYDKAKAGEEDVNQTKNKIQQLDTNIQSTLQKVSEYSNAVKDFIDNLETNVFLPKVASNMSVEINAILKAKEDLYSGRCIPHYGMRTELLEGICLMHF